MWSVTPGIVAANNNLSEGDLATWWHKGLNRLADTKWDDRVLKYMVRGSKFYNRSENIFKKASKSQD